MTSPSDPFQLIGTVIDGKYRVDHLIGEGGFGVVYGGFHLLVAQPIAIKCMKPSSGVASHQQRTTELFLREARVLFSLTHPNIVRLYDVGAICVPTTTACTPTPIPYVVLELIKGLALDQEIVNRQTQRGPHFSANEILTVFDQILDAIAFAHEHGVTHRDIKPSNIMLVHASGRLIVKVVDFGIARVSTLSPDTSTAAAPFTPRYAAPEQWDPTLGVVGPPSDIFALGLLLVETATLSPALPGHSIAELLNAVMNPQRRFYLRQERPDLPAELENIINLATRTKPGERIRSAREMRDGILRTLGCAQRSNPGVEATLAMASAHHPEPLPSLQSVMVNATTLPSGLSTTTAPYHSRTPLILGILGIIAVVILGAIGLGGYFIYKTAHELADSARILPSFPLGGPQTGPAKSSAPPARVGPAPKGDVVVSAISGQDPFWTRAEIDEVLQAHLGELDLCYEQHVGKPRSGLEWDLTLVITPEGSVMMPNCDASGPKAPAEAKAAANCYGTKASSWKFPPSHGKVLYLTSGAARITLVSKASDQR